MDGRFEKQTIVVDLEIISPLVEKIKKTLPVVIDTGCTSDLILTYTEAFSLALTLVGLQEYTIADGSRVTFFECLGKVKLGNKCVLCTVSIRPSGSFLMGVSLMKKLGLNLSVDFVEDTVQFTQSEPQLKRQNPITTRNKKPKKK